MPVNLDKRRMTDDQVLDILNQEIEALARYYAIGIGSSTGLWGEAMRHYRECREVLDARLYFGPVLLREAGEVNQWP